MHKHEVKESYIKKILKIEKEHLRKYGYRHMSLEELRKLFEHNGDIRKK